MLASVLTCIGVAGGGGHTRARNVQIAPQPNDIIFWGAGYAGSGGRQWKKKRNQRGKKKEEQAAKTGGDDAPTPEEQAILNAQAQEDPDSRAGRRGIVAAVSDGASPVQTILRALARVRRVVMVNEYR